MHLTREEEQIYNGEHGWANQTCMKILVRLGELFDAEKLIPIKSAHVSGISYKTLGDAPTEFLKTLADAGGKVKVTTTLNPNSIDPEYLPTKIPADLQNKQLHILKQFEKMGATKSLTCTPYYLKTPKNGTHLAWAESSAVVYANSVIGAYTNREGGPSALAAAVIGKTPNFGLHKTENRKPNTLVELETQPRNETEFGALGIHLGKILEDKIPLIRGLQDASKDELKQFSAALATSGMTNMFHRGEHIKHEKSEKITIETEKIKHTIQELTSSTTAEPDLVFIGCPHCSLTEIRKIAQKLEGKKIKKGTEFWVCTSHHIRENAKPYVTQIEASGGHVLAGVCTVVSWTEKLGIKTIMTNSAKTAYYAPTLNKAEAKLAPLQDCLKAATKR
jgi:predicted aconitase